MSEILSQNEIDQLMQALRSGDAGAGGEPVVQQAKVRNYDFRSANRIPREQMRTLNLIYEQYARHLATYLTGNLGVFCDAEVALVEEQKYFEFTNSITPTSLLVIIRMNPLPGLVLLRIAPEIAYAIVENLLGGAGSSSANRRTYTEIDLVILEKVVRSLLPMVNEAWDKIIKIQTTLESIETSLQFAQIVPPGEAIAIVTLQVQIGEVTSFINFCIPQTALEPFAQKLNAQTLAAGSHRSVQKDSKLSDSILQHVRKAAVPLKGILSETTLSVRDLMGLQIGDVIQLDCRTIDPIGIRIGHIPRLAGVLGIHNKRYAIKVTDIIYEEDAVHE